MLAHNRIKEVITLKTLYERKELLKKYGGPLPMSDAGFYKSCAEGKIPTVRIGKRVFVPSWFVDQLLNEPGENRE